MKQFAGLIVFLFVWSGCTLSPIDKVQQTIETQAKLLVDSGYIEKNMSFLRIISLTICIGFI